ncbi:MAG: hypothetical protein HRT68_04315 [Flavobacteriaceae bacterium]|nr:hypothetical protein [Flavobacteriaceae bacterium]
MQLLLVSFTPISCNEDDAVSGANNNNSGDNSGDNNGDGNDNDNSDYITDDHTTTNQISDLGATLGQILFYDVALSLNNTVSCASCYQQANAFSDLNATSTGVNRQTGRHSKRLIN